MAGPFIIINTISGRTAVKSFVDHLVSGYPKLSFSSKIVFTDGYHYVSLMLSDFKGGIEN